MSAALATYCEKQDCTVPNAQSLRTQGRSMYCRVGMFGIDLADYPKVKKFSDDFGNNQQVKAAREKMAAASK